MIARESTSDTPPGGNPTTGESAVRIACAGLCAEQSEAGARKGRADHDFLGSVTRAEYRGKTLQGQRRESGKGFSCQAHVHEVGEQDRAATTRLATPAARIPPRQVSQAQCIRASSRRAPVRNLRPNRSPDAAV